MVRQVIGDEPVSGSTHSTTQLAPDNSGLVTVQCVDKVDGKPPVFDVSGRYADIATAAPHNIPERGGKVWNRDDWLPMKDEPTGNYVWRIMFEGHTAMDAFMTAACAQIGQIMLNTPSALYAAGLISGSITMIFFILCGFWTLYVLLALYLQYKADKIRAGDWWDEDGKHSKVAQYFEIFRYFVGPFGFWSTLVVLVVVLLGVCQVQIIACATDMYFIDQSRTKREWSLIFGGIMVFTMIALPRFNKFRLLNIIGLVGTGMTAVYLIVDSAYHGFDDIEYVNKYAQSAGSWFTGSSVLLACLGSHGIMFEILEAMEQPAHFKGSYKGAWLWTVFVVIPHSIMVNLSYPRILGLGVQNVYAVTPMSDAKQASVYLMIIHQYVAFAIYSMPLCFIWEKMLRVHAKPFYIRFLCRIPIGAFIWFLAVLAPFYGPMNALYASFATPYIGFILPCATIMWIYRTKERRDSAVMKPWLMFRWGNYFLWWAVNITMVCFYLGFGGTSIYYSALMIKNSYKTWGAFAECYGCPQQVAAAALG